MRALIMLMALTISLQFGFNNLLELVFSLSHILRVEKFREDFVVYPVAKNITSSVSSPFLTSRETSPPLV